MKADRELSELVDDTGELIEFIECGFRPSDDMPNISAMKNLPAFLAEFSAFVLPTLACGWFARFENKGLV